MFNIIKKCNSNLPSVSKYSIQNKMVDMGTIILFYHFFLLLYNYKQSEKSRINTCNIHRTCTFVTNASNDT